MKFRLSIALLLFVTSINTFAKAVDTSSLDDVATDCRGENQKECIDKLRKKSKSQNSYNVVVIPVTTNYGKEYADIATSQLSAILNQNNVNVIDRGISESLREELIAIEQSGMSKGANYDIGDYAIKGDLTTIAASRVYKPATKNCDVFGKDCPNQCEVQVNTNINLILFNMNPLSKETTLALSGSYKQVFENVTQSSCDKMDVGQQERLAIRNIFEKKDHEIANLFPDAGYIIGHRVAKKKHYFKLNLNKSKKIPKKSKALITTQIERDDPVTGKSIETKTLGNAVVVETVGDEYIWIQLDKKSNPSEIRLGDSVKIKQVGCGLNPLCDLGKFKIPGLR